jgi:hypothetical protein
MTQPKFRIAKHDFAIKEARLEPFDSEDDDGDDVICWGVIVIAEENELLPGARPCLKFEHLFATKAGQPRYPALHPQGTLARCPPPRDRITDIP